VATIGNTFPTLLDHAKRQDPSGGIQAIVESMGKVNPLVEDMPFNEGNLTTGHRITLRNSLPSITWRRLNQGVDPGKSTSEQYDETCGMMEAYSKVDVDLADLNGDQRAFRASEDEAFIQAMGIELGNALFYYSTSSNPERIQGLTPRLNSTAATNPWANQIIKADASASGAVQTSIWLVGWSPQTVFGIYPKGSKVGLQSRDLGEQLVLETSSSTKQFLAWVTRYNWKVGLCVRDFRFIVRICNIDTARWTADLTAGTSDLAMSMMTAIARIFKMEMCRPVFYMHRDTFDMLNKQLVKRQANWLEWITVQNGPGRSPSRIPNFMGVPIRWGDIQTKTESVVS
jgi:hypothetical protein